MKDKDRRGIQVYNIQSTAKCSGSQLNIVITTIYMFIYELQ